VIKGTDRASGPFQAVNGALGGIARTALGFLSARTFERLAESAIGFAKSFVTEAMAAQEATGQLNTVLASTQGIAGVTSRAATDLADSLSKVTRFDDEAILSAESLLLTFTKINKNIFPSATEAVLNMSQALGQDLKSSAIQLGKALQDPILGVTALRRVGVNFNEAQADVIKAMVETGNLAGAQKLILQELEVEFGNSARAAGQTFPGQLAILRTAFGNVKEAIGAALIPALQKLLDLFNVLMPVISDTVLPALQSLGGWVAEIAGEWTRGFADLIARAANWGANIVESLAGGIEGSDAITRALRSIANTVTNWLAPGSPPKLLPDLTRWGAGALDAWLDGWTVKAAGASQFLQKLRGNLEPFLEKIDLGEAIDPTQLREVFGGDTPDVERYLNAYRDVGIAVQKVAAARAALTKAKEGGDEAAIAATGKQFTAAQKEEYEAKRAFYAQERRLEKRVSAEAQLARAISERSKVETEAANKAARAAAEAEQRAIEQAYLQYRLAGAGTADAQIQIWEEELAKVSEGTAKFWQIKTSIVELQKAMAKAGEGVGNALAQAYLQYRLAVASTPGAQIQIWEEELAKVEEGTAEFWQIKTRIVGLQKEAAGAGAGLGDSAGTAIDQFFNDSGAYIEQGMAKFDWPKLYEAGKRIAGEIWRGFTDWVGTQVDAAMMSLSNSLFAWANNPDKQRRIADAGVKLGGAVVAAIQGIFTNPDKIDATAATMESHLQMMALKAGTSAWTMGTLLGDSILAGIAEKLVPGKQDPADFLLAWDMAIQGYIPAAVGATFFDSEGMTKMTAQLVAGYQAIADDPSYLPAIRAAAAEQAITWANGWGAQLGPDLQTETNGALGALSVLEAGRAGQRAADAFTEGYRQQMNQYTPEGPELPPGYARGTSFYPGGRGIVGEQGPELVRLPRGSEILPADKTQRALGGSVIFEAGAIVINAPGGDPRQVEIGVRRGLRAAGVMP
jgi:hypothetical protein